MHTNRLFVLLGGLILILGARLPWISAPVLYGDVGYSLESIEIGWEDSGYIPAGVGLILLLIGIFWQGRAGKRYSLPAAILAVLPILLVIGSFSRILEMDPEAGFFAATDVGLYVTFLGPLLALVGGLRRTIVNLAELLPTILFIIIAGALFLASYLGRDSTSSPLWEQPAPQAVAADAQPVVIDTDMAADDWLAILYLLSRSDVAVQAITVTGTGEAHCPAGTRNALNLVALAGRPEIPVACGRETPLEGDHAFPTAWRDRVDGLLGLTLPENSTEPSAETAVELLARILQTSPKKVHLITLGPLTNLGELLQAQPGLVTNISMITVMDGAIEVPGNVGISSDIDNEVAGWNIYCDPHAAELVFASGAPITLVPLDATNDVPVSMEFYARLESDRTTSVAEFVYRVLGAQQQFIRQGSYYFWDPLAAAIATEESLATYQDIPLIVVEEEGPESGRTLRSERGFTIRVAMQADRERFEALFLDAVNGRLP